MSVPVSSLAPEPTYNGWGQYVLVPEGEKKAVGHTRITTFAASLDDRYHLEKWKQRMTARGLAERADLYAQVVATRAEEKAKLDKLCDDAIEAAKGSAGANLGTALHTMTQRLDLGEELEIPAPWDADVNAYLKTLRDHEVAIERAYVERTCVLPDWRLAGRFDRLVRFGSSLKVADLKTGASLDLSWGTIAVQLACYARAATLYDWATKTHTPMPTVDQEVALVIHLPAGQARCDLYWVDIAAGWEAAQLAREVRQWRKKKDLAQAWNDGVAITVPDVRRARFVERIEVLREHTGALSLLAARWPAGVATLKQKADHTTVELDAIDAALVAVEAEVGAAFGPLDPAHAVVA